MMLTKFASENDSLAVQAGGYAYFIPAVVFMLILAMAARTPLDSDLWWHLRAGEETVLNGSPYLVDSLSYTRGGEVWINHSWLAQVLIFGLYAAAGMRAISAGVAVLAAASLFLVYRQIEAHELVKAFAVVLSAIVASMVWSPRPQLFSLVFLGVVSLLVYKLQVKKENRLWLLLPLFMLWSNLHGGYILGFIYIGLYLTGQISDRLLGLEGSHLLPNKQLASLVLWSLLGYLSAAINPNGSTMWLIPFKTVGVGVLQEFISEWASPDFHQAVQQSFLWLLFLTLGVMGFSGLKPRSGEWLLVIGLAYLSLLARRNFGPFALICAPILGRHLWAVIQRYGSRVWDVTAGAVGSRLRNLFDRAQPENRPRPKHGLNIVLICILAVAVVLKWWVVTDPELLANAEREVFPVEAAAWINRNDPPAQLFNDYDWGGYLGWQARDYPIFVDGRTDLYHDEILKEYLRVVNAKPGWEAVLDGYHVNTILVKTTAPISGELMGSATWQLVFQDDLASIFTRKIYGRSD